MKHTFLFIYTLFTFSFSALAQTDTLVGWTFPGNSADDTVDFFISSNAHRVISTESSSRPIDYLVTGIDTGTDKCAQSVQWDNGAGLKYWMIELVTAGYSNLKLSSINRSCPMHHGPRDFKVQYKLHGQSIWTDVVGGMIEDTANWTKGALGNLTLPMECHNQSQPISIRWLMTSNFDIKGDTVTKMGMSRMDNIFVTGNRIQTDVATLSDLKLFEVFPNPAHGWVQILNTQLNPFHVQLFNMTGQMVLTSHAMDVEHSLKISFLPAGIYWLKLDSPQGHSVQKLIIQ